MSSTEIISVASAVIAFLSTCMEIARAAEDVSGLPPAFRDAAARLPLIQDSFAVARQGLNIDDDRDSKESLLPLKAILESAEAKALSLRSVFEASLPSSEMSGSKRYVQAIKNVTQRGSVEKLVEGITRDLQALTANYTVRAAMRAQIGHNLEQIEAINKDSVPTISLRNNGSGQQIVFNGTGNQNVATGTATQINGVSHGGTFNFIQN